MDAYDSAVEVWLDATRKVLDIGSDDPLATGADLKMLLENTIEEHKEV